MAKDIDPDEDRSEELETGFQNQSISEGEEAVSDIETTENPVEKEDIQPAEDIEHGWGKGKEIDEEGGIADTGT